MLFPLACRITDGGRRPGGGDSLRYRHEHGHRHHRRQMSRRVMVLIVLGLLVLYVGVIAGIRLVGDQLEGRDVPEPVGSLDGRFDVQAITTDYRGRTWTYRERDLTNILVVGIDWAEMPEASISSRYGGQADFLLLITLDRENRTVSTLQIDRDTLADIRIYGPFGDFAGKRQTQICLAQAFGESLEENCENTAWAVSQLLGGIPVDRYMALDMGGIAALNDALGGITVTLEDDFSALDPQMTAGTTLTLQGKQAEYFVRSRMGVGEGTNSSRMKRQRAYIQAAGDLMVRGMEKDMNYAGSVLDGLGSHMITNMERGWLINKAYESRDYLRQDMRTLAGLHQVGDDGFMEFHADKDALGSLLVSIFFE